ncbi:hypothetical protein KY329_00855 [Candidatus Woesearchaeota archaeon]|nr:hypothetical protein [Candidatus Woesearchaeota archaeon]
MVERHLVIDDKRIKYGGVFDARGLFDVIKTWANDKGYWLVEKGHSESLKQGGKFIEFNLYPVFKKLTDYAKSIFKIKIQMSEVKDVVVEQDGRKVKLQDGKVNIRIDANLETDYEGKWETKPLLYFLRTVFEKYVFTPSMVKFDARIREDAEVLETHLKSFLNLGKFRS